MKEMKERIIFKKDEIIYERGGDFFFCIFPRKDFKGFSPNPNKIRKEAIARGRAMAKKMGIE